MSLKDTLKKSDLLRKPVKRGKNYFEFFSDARDFSNHYAEVVEKEGDYRYRLMLLIHNLEKGMCREDIRPYGKDKAREIIKILKEGTEKKTLFEYKLAKAALISWDELYRDKGWEQDNTIRSYIESLGAPDLIAGRVEFQAPIKALNSGLFTEILFSRRSVRDYENIPLSEEDVNYALDCFLHAPTACNRQMCKIYRVENQKMKDLVNRKLLGISGFNTKAMTLFLITFDNGAFEFYGERNQGYINVGLTAMNFANGLHARGIGSCFMQWANKRAEDKEIRKALGIPERERIGLVLGAGYYKKSVLIPCSTKKSREDVYSVI